MKKDGEYWRERFQQLENAMHSKSTDIVKYIIRQYQIAMRNMDKELAFWYQKFADVNGISFQEAKRLLNTNELPEFHASVAEYIAIAQRENLSYEWKRKLENASNRVKISRMENLQLALQSAIEKLFKKQADTLIAELPSVYDSSYYHTAFEIQKGFGIGYTFQGADANKLKTVLSKPWVADGKTFSDRIWENKDRLVNVLNLEMTQAVIRGDDYRRAASGLASRMKASQGAAMRLVMTESAFIASQAQHDCFKSLDVEQYEFIATLDRHTSTICRSMDKKHFKMSDFKPGTTAPPMHPNCRSCTAPYFGDEEDIGRAARDLDDSKTFHVSGDMSYNDWKDKISTQNDLISKGENDIINNIPHGALTDTNDPDHKKRDRHAEVEYTRIKNNGKNVFVSKITTNTGLPRRMISTVYDHVFTQKHILYDRVDTFLPDFEMAKSFQRLKEGNYRPEDIVLLRHEYLEHAVEKRFKTDYKTAHNYAEKHFDYARAIWGLVEIDNTTFKTRRKK